MSTENQNEPQSKEGARLRQIAKRYAQRTEEGGFKDPLDHTTSQAQEIQMMLASEDQKLINEAKKRIRQLQENRAQAPEGVEGAILSHLQAGGYVNDLVPQSNLFVRLIKKLSPFKGKE